LLFIDKAYSKFDIDSSTFFRINIQDTNQKGVIKMRKILAVLIFGLIIVLPIFADYVELGTGGILLLNRPYCGS